MTLRNQIKSVKQNINPLKILEENANDKFNNTLIKSTENSINKPICNDELCKQQYFTKMGLINIGESCYMNATLQILLHCKSFVE